MAKCAGRRSDARVADCVSLPARSFARGDQARAGDLDLAVIVASERGRDLSRGARQEDRS